MDSVSIYSNALIPSCDTISKGGDEFIAEDFRFIREDDKVDLKSADIHVKHNGVAVVMWVYMQTEDDVGSE